MIYKVIPALVLTLLNVAINVNCLDLNQLLSESDTTQILSIGNSKSNSKKTAQRKKTSQEKESKKKSIKIHASTIEQSYTKKIKQLHPAHVQNQVRDLRVTQDSKITTSNVSNQHTNHKSNLNNLLFTNHSLLFDPLNNSNPIKAPSNNKAPSNKNKPIENQNNTIKENDSESTDKTSIKQKKSDINPIFTNQDIKDYPLLKDVKQYGYDMFNTEENETYIDSFLPVSDDYTIGPGDELTINIWGKIESEIIVEVNNQGKIKLPKVGSIKISGHSLKKTKSIIKHHLEKEYINFEIDVVVSYQRTIKVFILGNVKIPGSYQLPANSTAIHALYKSGGPEKIGSLRTIKLIRNKTKIQEIDLYKFLLYGSNTQDPILQNNDTIFVPPIGKTTLIAGDVKRPGIYEYQNKSSIHDAISLAAGLTGTSVIDQISIYRTTPKKNQEVITHSFQDKSQYKKTLSKKKIQDMDIVFISPAASFLTSYISIEGDVFYPGKFQFKPNVTVENLVRLAMGTRQTAYLKRADIYREADQSLPEIITIDLTNPTHLKTKLVKNDRLKVYSKDDAQYFENTVTVSGAVSKDGEYRLLKNMRVLDLLFLAKPTQMANQKTIEIMRQDNTSSSKRIITVDLDLARKNPNSIYNPKLNDQDKVVVKEDSSLIHKKIELKGEVNHPGIYYLSNNETLYSVIKRAGGFTKDAFLPGAIFTRKTVQENINLAQTKVLNEERKRILFEQIEISSYAQSVDINQLFKANQTALLLLEEKIEKNKGRVVINLSNNAEFKTSKNNIELQDGDQLIIPQKPSSIFIFGGVQHSTAILYEPQKKGTHYIAQAGGLSNYANRKKAYVIKANGSISKNLNKIDPGDMIYIPEQAKIRTNWAKFFISFADITYKVAIGIAAIKGLQ